jgi:hypothetical protein
LVLVIEKYIGGILSYGVPDVDNSIVRVVMAACLQDCKQLSFLGEVGLVLLGSLVATLVVKHTI